MPKPIAQIVARILFKRRLKRGFRPLQKWRRIVKARTATVRRDTVDSFIWSVR